MTSTPDDQDPLDDWAALTKKALTGRAAVPKQAPARAGFLEHFTAALVGGVNPTGPLGELLPLAVGRRWIDRATAVETAFVALDGAQRPVDRKVWTGVLRQGLGVTDEELLDWADLLVAVLSHGDSAVATELAPPLIAGGDEDLLGDVLAVTLPTDIKKVARTVLDAAATRPRPAADVVSLVSALLPPHLASSDRQLVRSALLLTARWRIALEDDEPEPTTTVGLWRPTPPVWQLPRFRTNDPDAAPLTELAGRLLGRPAGVVDVEAEQFLASATAVAWHDPAAARVALAGVPGSEAYGLRHVRAWVDGVDPRHTLPAVIADPADSREVGVMRRLGELPLLLSTPTWLDLGIDIADLVGRLRRYASTGAVVCGADLRLALTRVDPADATDDVLAALADLEVRVDDGTTRAGPVVAEVLRRGRTAPRAGIHLTRGPELGLLLRQLARGREPLGRRAATAMLTLQRDPHPSAAADAATAVREAWSRGLIRPGSVDVTLLEEGDGPTGLATFATFCLDLAHDGMLALVWPVLDDVVALSASRSRLLTGTADVIDVLGELLPEARGAVDSGAAEPSTLRLPGVSATAGRPGKARAVIAARRLIERART